MRGFFVGAASITTFATMTLSLFKIFRRMHDQAPDADFKFALGEEEDWKPYKSMKTMTVTWFYGLAVMFPPFVGWGSFSSESGGTICIPNWRDNTSAGHAYLITLVILAFVAPLYVSLVCFARIYRKSRKLPDENLRTTKEKTLTRKAVKMVVLGVVSFSISWTPYCVSAMISVIGGSEIFDRDQSFIPGIFAKASLMYNPLLCMLVCKRWEKGKECVEAPVTSTNASWSP